MKPDPRIQQIESRLTALLQIVEKQNETQAQQNARLTALEARLSPPDGYKPLFDRWPGNVG